MKMLLVEDDPHKADKILGFLSELRPDISVSVTRSYQSGLKKIFSEFYDLILLDMSLPVYEIKAGESGFDAPSFAGEDILDEMRRKKVKARVVVVTQFETFGEGSSLTTLAELSDRLALRFPGLFIRTIHYSPAESTWMKQLAECISTL